MPLDPRFKLQTMEIGVPSIVISRNGIFLSKNLYKKLNGIQFVQVYLSEETKEIAIVPCTESDEASVALKVANDYARIYNKDFINNIASLMGTTFNEINMRVMGTAIENYYVFDLKTAKSGRQRKDNTDEE